MNRPDPSHHEAAHAVAAYIHRFPGIYVELQPITNGRVGENAHFVQDLEAVNLACDFLNQRGLPCNKAILIQCTVLEIARATNVVMNNVELNQAIVHAQDDLDFRNEIFRLNGFSERQRNEFNRASRLECEQLIRNRDFQIAVESVADLLINQRIVLDCDVARAVEGVTPLRCRPLDGEPTHSEVQLEAYKLHTRRMTGYGALDNWLSAERGLRFVKFTTQ